MDLDPLISRYFLRFLRGLESTVELLKGCDIIYRGAMTFLLTSAILEW
jgi:hypothetical protein